MFKSSCQVTFYNNKATQYGAAIASVNNSCIMLTGNAKVTFISDFIHPGVPLYSYFNSNISFGENSITTFSIKFKPTSLTAIPHSSPFYHGKRSYASFKEKRDGAIYSDNHISFEGNSTTTFNFNTDTNVYLNFPNSRITVYYDSIGKAAVFCLGRVYFRGSSTSTFNDITTNDFPKYTLLFGHTIIFDDNSTVNFNKQSNKGDFIASFKIIEKGHSVVAFNYLVLSWCTLNICNRINASMLVGSASIKINFDGKVHCTNSSAYVCQSNKCHCENLKDIIQAGAHNNLLDISNKVVSLFSFNVLGSSLIGHNSIVYCNQSGGLRVKANDVIIEGITWIGYGWVKDATVTKDQILNAKGVLLIFNHSNITIQICSFQFSSGQVINLNNGSRDIRINECKFVNNNIYKGHGVAILSQSSFTISNCYFSSNKGGKSVIYIEQYNSKVIEQRIFLINSSFYNNRGASIYLNHHCRLQINGDVLFDSNVANNGAGIYINNQSSVIFGENSDVKFINNLVVHSGAAIFVNNQSSVLFDNNSMGVFINNKATNGIIYAEVSSNITFKAICNVTFSNNSVTQYGASIYSIDNSHITFKNNSTVTFIGNAANNGGAVALYNSSTATIKEHSNLTFSNNTSKNSGGALYFTNHCHFHFTDNSITLFVGNSAKDYGGAIQSAFNSRVRFKKNSKILFEDNRATFGETLHARGNSLVTINSDVTINGNTAMWNYGGYLTNTIDDIHIDANGIVRCNDYKEYYICRYAKCFCKNLADTPSNAAVIITGNVTISSVITLTGIVNISIIGYNNSSILSVNDGGMQLILYLAKR